MNWVAVNHVAVLVLVAVIIMTLAESSPWLSRTLLRWAARRCFDTDEQRERFAEEWLADLDDVPGPASELAHTLGVLLLAAAPIWARSCWRRSRLARQLDRATTRSRAGLAGIDAGSGAILARAGAAALALALTGLVAVHSVALWDVSCAAHPRPAGRLLTSSIGSTTVAFTPDGRTLGICNGDGTIRLWNVATGQQLGSALGIRNVGAVGVVFSPDGRTLAICNGDGTIRLWNVTSALTGDPRLTHTPARK